MADTVGGTRHDHEGHIICLYNTYVCSHKRHNDTTLLLEPRAQLVGAAVLGLERAFDKSPPVAPVPSSAGPEDSCRNPDRDDTFHRARALLFARNLRGIRIIGEEGSLIDGYGRPWYGCLLKTFRLSCALHAKVAK